MGNRLGISAATSSSTSPSQHHPPRRPTSPSTQASGIAATSYSGASSSNTSSPASLLSTSSASQEDERRTSAEITTTTANALTTTSAPLSTTITAASTTTAAVTTTATSTTTSVAAAGRRRLRNTQADRYYEQYQLIPLPTILHDNLERMMKMQVMDVESKVVAENDGKVNGIIMNKNGDGAIGLDIAALTIGNNTDAYPQNNINYINTTITITTNNKRNIQRSKRILVIGDVHGCITELHTLVQKATQQHNSGIPFAAIIIVGDLCNKGPHSTAVIRHVRTQPNWFSIRGNNEDRALTYALSQWDEKDTTIKQKYKWIAYGEDPLSDEDVEWMANLPYTITIPKTMFDDYYHDQEEYDDEENEEEEEEEMNLDSCSSGGANENHGIRTSAAKRQRQRLHDDDIIIVHAGLDTRIPTLEKQDIHTMVNIRDVQLVMNDKATATENDDIENNTVDEDENDEIDRNRDHCEKEQEQGVMETKKKERTAWAKLWQGPQLVIFGHDARRGLQTEKYAIGLDSGCCYGRELTGIILPEGEYVSVEATRVHCPFKKKKK